jgi:hypothetical protein
MESARMWSPRALSTQVRFPPPNDHPQRSTIQEFLVKTLDSSISRRRLMQVTAASAAAVGLSSIATHALAAQDATPTDGGLPPLPEGATLVAEGLYNPGNLVIGPDGTLYIAETGVAGGMEGDPAATPDPQAEPAQGPAPLVPGRISMVAPDGTQGVLTDAFGGIGIGIFEGEVFASTGGTSVSMGMVPLPEENTISAVNVETGETRIVASLGDYEVEHNPDGTDVNPNLYGLSITSDGTIHVADAGGNTLYAVDAASGAFELTGVVPNLTELTGATPDAELGARQPVPTAVIAHDDGTLDVFLLSEGWDGPNVLRMLPDGTVEPIAQGLSMLVSAVLGPDGKTYVSQLTADFSGEMPAPGNVYRIDGDVAEPVVENLFFPHGIAFDAEGNLYVAVNSIISGPDAPAGQVIRIDGVAAV